MLAVPAMLTMQFLADCNRPAFAYGVAAMNSLPPSSLATLLAPNLFGTLNHTYDYWGPMWDTVPEGTYTDRAINYLFAGTLPVLLLFWQGLGRGRLFDAAIRASPPLLGLVALVYALGRYTPVFVWLFDHVPGIKLYRRPADATFLINVALAFCAGYFIHRLSGGQAELACRRAVAPWLASAARRRRRRSCRWSCSAQASSSRSASATLTRPRSRPPSSSASRHSAFSLLLPQTSPTSRARRRVAARRGDGRRTRLAQRGLGAELRARQPLRRLRTLSNPRFRRPDRARSASSTSAMPAASGPASRSSASAAPGRTPRWSSGIEDTVGYNALRIAEYEKAVGPGENAVELSCASSPARSAATSATSPRCSASNTSCSTAPPRSCPGISRACAMPADLRLGHDVHLPPGAGGAPRLCRDRV